MRKRPGELETQLLGLLWKIGPADGPQLHAALGEQVAYTTVMTVLQRLYVKGDVDKTPEGRRFIYRAKRKPGALLDRLKARLFGGRSLELIQYLIATGDDLSDEDLETMERLIQEKRCES